MVTEGSRDYRHIAEGSWKLHTFNGVPGFYFGKDFSAMLDSKQIKTLGLRFVRTLQVTVKSATVFTIEHKSCDRPIQQSFLLLNNLLKEVGQFTFGFVDNQVMLNNLLTTDTALRHLETEFLKRGVAGITFEPGLTMARYRKVVQFLSAPTAAVEAAGGLLAFLDKTEIESVRILPAAKNQKKNEQGDTILETDSESYLLSKQMGDDQASRDFLDSIDALLESGCFDASMRTEVLSDFAIHGMGGDAYGVPMDIPNLVVLKDGQAVGPATGGSFSPGGDQGGGGRALHAAAGQGSPTGTYSRQDASAFPATATGGPGRGGSIPGTSDHGFTGGYGAPSSAEAARIPALAKGGRKAGPQGSGSFLELVEASVQRSLLEEKGNPEKSYSSLARILRNTGIDKILEHFPPVRREELKTLAPEQLAAEYIEDTALKLAGTKLTASTTSSHKIQIEEEVVHVLARSLQATHMADRLAQKLTKFIQDFAVPPHIQEKIREELQWTSLNANKKYARLMEIKHYSSAEFRHLLELIKELVSQRDMERATALAGHYFEFLDEPNVPIETTELSRVPELIRTIPLAQVELASKTAERLGRTLQRDDVSEFIHYQAASALTVLGQSIAAFEDFQDVLAIAISLEASNNRDREKHKKCCGTGLAHLVPANAVERIIELYLMQRNESVGGRATPMLLRLAAPASTERVFARLIDDSDARNRLALVRLAGQLGKDSIEVAQRYLGDERWYVVRNMCGVLAELKDPNLVEHIVPALEHEDSRVQQAALKALVKSRSTRAASVLAAALPKLNPDILDETLDELMFLKNASSIAALEAFISGRGANLACLRKAVLALGAIQDDAALDALGRVFRIEELDRSVRHAALLGISGYRSPRAEQVLQELSTSWGQLADEARKELEKRKSK